MTPGDEHRGDVEDMIGVKVRQGDMRDRRPVNAERGEPKADAAPAVEEEPYVATLDEVPGLHTVWNRCGSPGADGRQAHYGPRKMIFFVCHASSTWKRTR